MKAFMRKNQGWLVNLTNGDAENSLLMAGDYCCNADGKNAGGNPPRNSRKDEDLSEYGDTGSQPNDPGSGAGGTDYVGRNTGTEIDDSLTDTVSGGSASDRSGAGAGADDAAPDPSSSGLSRMGAGSDVEGSMNDYETRRSELETNTDQGRFAGTGGDGNQPIQDADETGGTGSGSAFNDHGSRIHDIPAGTGSAQRGNRAGMEDEDEGTITGGTAPYTGMGDSATAQGRKLYDHEKEQRKPEE